MTASKPGATSDQAAEPAPAGKLGGSAAEELRDVQRTASVAGGVIAGGMTAVGGLFAGLYSLRLGRR